jgi:hypothetical protein
MEDLASKTADLSLCQATVHQLKQTTLDRPNHVQTSTASPSGVGVLGQSDLASPTFGSQAQKLRESGPKATELVIDNHHTH